MKHRLVACLLMLLALPSGAVESLKFTVHGMVCAFCAQGIERRVAKLGVSQDIYVDLKKKIVAVQAREGQVLDSQAIAAEIVEAGFAVVKIEPVSQSVAEIKAAQKGRP
jgi:copper chaperone CopZ